MDDILREKIKQEAGALVDDAAEEVRGRELTPERIELYVVVHSAQGGPVQRVKKFRPES